MAKFLFNPLIGNQAVTARLGAGNAEADRLKDNDVNKALKLVADSRYALCALGDKIDAFVSSVDTATADGYSTGGIFNQAGHRMYAEAEGSEAAGTGALAVGDYVVCGTPEALGTAVGDNGPKVRKATNQPGTAVTVAAATVADINTALAAVADQQKVANAGWRVVSLCSAGTGAVGTKVLIERVV